MREEKEMSLYIADERSAKINHKRSDNDETTAPVLPHQFNETSLSCRVTSVSSKSDVCVMQRAHHLAALTIDVASQ